MNKELSVLLNAVQEAGDAILSLQKSGFSVEKKKNNELLTQADLLANQILRAHLSAHFPKDDWLSEESEDSSTRLTAERIWVVDPIDGTIEYATGVPEYAISVALVQSGKPILACVYNPAKNHLFHAVRGEGAWEGDKRLVCRKAHSSQLHFLASRSEYQRGEWSRFELNHQVEVIGSIAYKLALIAAGYADATFSLGPKSEWDIAAGVLLVEEAGGVVCDKQHQPFIFNQHNVRVNGIIATSFDAKKRVMEMIAASAHSPL